MNQMTITIGKDGKVDLDVLAASGSKCTDLTAKIEQALGSVQDRNFKPEYYETNDNNTWVQGS